MIAMKGWLRSKSQGRRIGTQRMKRHSSSGCAVFDGVVVVVKWFCDPQAYWYDEVFSVAEQDIVSP
jgi:hypothetical protein